MYVPYLLKMQIKKHTVFFFLIKYRNSSTHTVMRNLLDRLALTLTYDGMQSVKITQGAR